jgi:hypothetical protein
MDFSAALTEIKAGNRLTRAQWKNASYVFLVPGSTFEVNRPPLLGILPEGTSVTYRSHIDMMGTDGLVGTWGPSSVDIFTDDWAIVPEVVAQ